MMKGDVPPPYEARPRDDAQDDPILEPTIFILAGQSIHAETADGPAAYELSRAVATLTKATEKVEFERVDQTISASASPSGTPTVRRRRRHLYDLRHSAPGPRTIFGGPGSEVPEYYIHSQSPRRTLGHVGLARAGRHGSVVRALPVHVPAATASRARFAGHGAKPLFELSRSGGRLRWAAAADPGETVAIEDAADLQRRLILTRALPRKEVDALVALWCCNIWQEAAERSDEALKEIQGSSFMRKMDTGRAVYLGTNIY